MKFTFDFIHMFFVDLGYASPILIFLIVCISLMGYIIGRKEGWSRFDALYHAFINATTVGYGDLYPTKKTSKLLSVAIAVVGLIFTGIVIAIGVHAVDQAFNKVYESSERPYRIEK
jgi:voltage-gated potassium channel